MIDWQSLLRRYMAHVQESEGVTFVEHLTMRDGEVIGGFTQEEVDALIEMGEQVVDAEQRRKGVAD